MYQITTNTAFSHYNDHCRSCGRRESSLNLNRYAQVYLQEYLLECQQVRHIAIATVDRFLLRSFLLWLQETKSLSLSTVQRIYDVLNAMFNFLVNEELIAASPMAKVEKPRRSPKPINPLSTEQVQTLIDGCNVKTFTGLRNRLVVALMFDTGVRATELSYMDLDDVNFTERKILLRETKTGVPRFVYYSGIVARLISRYLLLRGEDSKGRLIITEEGNPVDRHWLRLMLIRLGDRVGIRVHPHLMRHSCAVALIKNGSDIGSVMRQLGHANPRMSLHYSKLADADIQEMHRQTSPADKLNISRKGSRRKRARQNDTNMVG